MKTIIDGTITNPTDFFSKLELKQLSFRTFVILPQITLRAANLRRINFSVKTVGPNLLKYYSYLECQNDRKVLLGLLVQLSMFIWSSDVDSTYRVFVTIFGSSRISKRDCGFRETSQSCQVGILIMSDGQNYYLEYNDKNCTQLTNGIHFSILQTYQLIL